MLSRYQIVRGKRPPSQPLPPGTRQDTRKHTRHLLRPTPQMVAAYLARPDDRAFEAFRAAYLALLDERISADREAFAELARLATEGDVHLGCSCPTKNNPDVNRCHTTLALGFMKKKFPKLEITWPA